MVFGFLDVEEIETVFLCSRRWVFLEQRNEQFHKVIQRLFMIARWLLLVGMGYGEEIVPPLGYNIKNFQNSHIKFLASTINMYI